MDFIIIPEQEQKRCKVIVYFCVAERMIFLYKDNKFKAEPPNVSGK